MVSVDRNVVFDIDTNAEYKQKQSIISTDIIVTETLEEDGPPVPVGSFVRGSRDSAYREGGLTSRLSTVIRRSLRLAPKRTTTVRHDRQVVEKKLSQLATVDEERQVSVIF